VRRAQPSRRARNAGRPVSYDDLLVAITGEESHTGTDRQLRIAIHEAGHAVAALAFAELRLEHVTIVGRGNRGGGASFGMSRQRAARSRLETATIHPWTTAAPVPSGEQNGKAWLRLRDRKGGASAPHDPDRSGWGRGRKTSSMP
jgi:hypothetical protein